MPNTSTAKFQQLGKVNLRLYNVRRQKSSWTQLVQIRRQYALKKNAFEFNWY